MSNISGDDGANIVNMPGQIGVEVPEERGACWKYDVGNQFPIEVLQTDNGQVTVDVNVPHKGYSIQARVKHGKLSGVSHILNKRKIEVASLVFVDGVANGPCTLYDDEGIIFFEGYFENGYREGRGKEYDENGKPVFDGFFHKGKRVNLIPMSGMKGYWKELNEDNEVVSICRKNKYGKNNGICYFYSNGVIDRVSRWKNGKEVSVMKKFGENRMTEFVRGVKRYEGEYRDSIESGYPREGEGEEYDVDGEGVSYHGWYLKGKRHGRGIAYRRGRRVYDGMWFKGLRFRPLLVVSLVLMVAITVLSFLVNLILGCVVIVLFLVICTLIWRGYSKAQYGFDYQLQTKMQLQNSVVIVNRCCNLCHRFILYSRFFESIVIGDDCFEKVNMFKIDGLRYLKSLKIGSHSFTLLKSKDEWDEDKAKNANRSFHILSCDELKSIEIGRFSFSDYGGGFELKNLPKLSTIKIGKIGSDSFNFYYSSFEIKGVIDMILIMNRSSTFEFY